MSFPSSSAKWNTIDQIRTRLYTFTIRTDRRYTACTSCICTELSVLRNIYGALPTNLLFIRGKGDLHISPKELVYSKNKLP